MQGLPDTDPFITRVRGGIAKDVSIGFYPLEDGTGQPFQFRCSLCGRDMLRDPGCEHIPGVPYPIYDSDGNQTGEQMATAWVHNAHLAEVSPVYDGATPGAGIIKATQEAEAGRLRPEVARMLEARYRSMGLTLFGAQHVWTAAEPISPQRAQRDAEPKTEPRPDPAPDARALRELDALRAEARTQREQLAAQAAQVKTLAGEAENLRLQAADGLAYRRDLIAAAMAEGVRALGEDFRREAYEALLERAPITTIKQMRDDWKQQGDARFPAPRVLTDGKGNPLRDQTGRVITTTRQTNDTDPRETGKRDNANAPAKRQPVVPASAYQG